MIAGGITEQNFSRTVGDALTTLVLAESLQKSREEVEYSPRSRFGDIANSDCVEVFVLGITFKDNRQISRRDETRDKEAFDSIRDTRFRIIQTLPRDILEPRKFVSERCLLLAWKYRDDININNPPGSAIEIIKNKMSELCSIEMSLCCGIVRYTELMPHSDEYAEAEVYPKRRSRDPIPPMPEIDKSDIELYADSVKNIKFSNLAKCLFSYTENCEDDIAPILSFNGISILGKSDVMTISAVRKCGKSTVCAMLAAVLSSDLVCLGFKRETPAPLKVLFCDTEQSKRSARLKQTLIQRMLGISENQEVASVPYLRLRSMKAEPKTMQATIKDGIAMYRPDVVIVDLASDLLTSRNFNDESDSAALLDTFEGWCEKYNCSIITTAHLTENKKNDTGELGHLGKSLTRGAAASLRLDSYKGCIRGSFVLRDECIEEPFYFRRDGDTLILVDKPSDKNTENQGGKQPKKRLTELDRIYSDNPCRGLSKEDIRKRYTLKTEFSKSWNDWISNDKTKKLELREDGLYYLIHPNI